MSKYFVNRVTTFSTSTKSDSEFSPCFRQFERVLIQHEEDLLAMVKEFEEVVQNYNECHKRSRPLNIATHTMTDGENTSIVLYRGQNTCESQFVTINVCKVKSVYVALAQEGGTTC